MEEQDTETFEEDEMPSVPGVEPGSVEWWLS